MYKAGIQLQESSVKWAKLSLNKKNVKIEALQSDPLSSNPNVKPLYFPPEQDVSLISGLDSIDTLFKEVELPTCEKNKILKLLPFRVESELPYPAEETVLGLQLSTNSGKKVGKAAFFAVKAPVLEDHIKQYSQNKLEVEQVSCAPAALCRFFKFFFPSLPQALILHVGEKTTTALFIEKGQITFSHAFSLGIKKLSCEDSFSQGQKEIDRIFTFLENKLPKSSLPLVITGDFSQLPNFFDIISNHIPSCLEITALPPYKGYETSTLLSYAIPIGLALEGLLQDGKSFSFCQGPFSTKEMKEKRKKRLRSFSLATLALACSFFFMGNMYLEQKKQKLIKGFSFIAPKEKSSIQNIQELEKELSFLEVKEQKEQKKYSIVLPTPTVSEVLARLSTHPSFSKEVEITKIDYHLVKYPKATSPKEPYSTKVDLELWIKTPKAAAQFYDKFCQNNPIISTKKEITWKEIGSIYYLSFYLKPCKELSR